MIPQRTFDLDERRFSAIQKALECSVELAKLTSQNGWIDSHSLVFEIIDNSQNVCIVNVLFDEILMEGAGCVAGRHACYGQLRMIFSAEGMCEKIEII